MFWYVILMLFSPLYLMFGLVFRSEQARLVLALYHQVLILLHSPTQTDHRIRLKVRAESD